VCVVLLHKLIWLQEEVLRSQRHVIGGLADIGVQQREVLASAAQLWQVRPLIVIAACMWLRRKIKLSGHTWR